MTNIDEKQFEGLSEKEKEIALKILQEYSETGQSTTYDNLLYQDYKEIPVDIETFLRDRRYLGNGLTNDDGTFTVFPYWVNKLKEIFPTNVDTSYNTLILTGAIGLGKSLVAVLCVLYLLYRMLCLKNPYVYYGLQQIDHITFSFINITLDAAKGVAWAKCQELLKCSPWFLEHGTLSKSQDPTWSPNGGIELIYGSLPRHVLGRAVFCLDGDTEILTTKGIVKLKDCVDKNINTFSFDKDNNKIVQSDICTVEKTGDFEDVIQLELEDGTIICCTPNHKFLLKSGEYVEAQFLSEDDELFELNDI